MQTKIRWGILGTGSIARRIAAAVQFVEDAELVAVGSRTQESAEKFANEFNIPRRHASYEALVADPEVDVIYVSTPHPFHKDNSLLALEAGKAVLCEKPFTMNAAEAMEVVGLARVKRLFLMEAMWTRYLPVMVKVRELIAQGAIGEVRMLNADFGFRANPINPKSRTFDLALGGGAVLDVGVYPISLASMLFGTPSEVVSAAHLGETGVDEQNVVVLKYPAGQLAITSSAVRTTTPQEAFIIGTEGRIHIAAEWWRGQQLTLKAGGKDEVFDVPYEGNGFNYEVEEVGRCLRAGLLESPIMPLDETISIMRTMDTVRAEWGLVYPTEQ